MVERRIDTEKRRSSRASQELAATLRYYRDLSGLTIQDFAKKLGISKQYLHSLLAGIGNPTLETMEGMAEKLGLEFSPVFRAPIMSKAWGDGSPRQPQLPPSRRRGECGAVATIEIAPTPRLE